MSANKMAAVPAMTLAMATTSLLAAGTGMEAAPSKALREKMAQLHAYMAQCRRSDRPSDSAAPAPHQH